MELLVLYKDKLIEYFKTDNQNFDMEDYFKRFIEKNLDLSDLDMEKINFYLEKLEIEGNIETKDLMIKVLSHNMVIFKSEIKKLKVEVVSLKRDIQELMNKTENNQKNFGNKSPELERELIDMPKSIEECIESIDYESNLDEQIAKKTGNLEENLNFIEDNPKKAIKEEYEFSKYVTYRFSSETIKENALKLSNFNMTVERKKVNGWIGSGIRCNDTSAAPFLDKQTFSIKIHKITKSASILFGFCAKSADKDAMKGYCGTDSSFMLHLSTGCFYSRSFCQKFLLGDLKKHVFKNQIFSACLDVKMGTITFFLNGKRLESAIEIKLKPEEMGQMCPCVDLASKGDKVSLVFQEIEF